MSEIKIDIDLELDVKQDVELEKSIAEEVLTTGEQNERRESEVIELYRKNQADSGPELQV